MNNNGASIARVKGHAARLGLDFTHLTQPVRLPVPGRYSTRPRPELLRVSATSIATAWFTLCGHAVAVPTEPQLYDLLVELPDGFQRVQVKSSTSRVAAGSWQVRVGRRPYSIDKSAGATPYDPGSVDYFFVVVGDGRLFLIPSEMVAGRVNIYADSYSAYCIGDASSLLAWRE